MKALILKDAYVIWRQMKYFLVMILIFSALPSGFNNAFAVVYAAMLPYTALAYDERSKWDQLAAMMPYSGRDVVLGKYAFGWLCIAAATVLSSLIGRVISLFQPRDFSGAFLVMSLCGALCTLDLTLPLLFRFGVEKGRAAMFVLIFLVCGSAGAISTISLSGNSAAVSGPLLLLLPLITVALTAVSIPLSIRFFERRAR